MLSSWFGHPGKSTQCAYDYLRESSSMAPWVRIVWRQHLQPNHAFTLWLLVHRRLPTKDRKAYMEDMCCTFCGDQQEMQDHLFFRCQPISQLWRRVQWWLQMKQEMTTYRRMLQVFKLHYRGSNGLVKARHLAMSSLVHYVW